MWNLRSKTSFRPLEITGSLKTKQPRDQPSPVCGWCRPVDFANVSVAGTSPCGHLRLFRKRNPPSRNWPEIADCELCICDVLLQRPRCLTQRCFARNRSNLEIYADACERSPLDTDITNCVSGEVIWGILAISGELCEYFSLGINDEIPPTG